MSTLLALQSPLFPARTYTLGQKKANSGNGMTQKQSRRTSKAPTNIIIDDGKLRINIAIENIVFAKAEHVYVSIYFCNEQRVLQRGSLSNLLSQLPTDQFIQVHRSYIINLAWVESWTKSHVVVGGKMIPISRSRRQAILAILATNKNIGTS